MKVCSKCGMEKEPSDFWKGRFAKCKDCFNEERRNRFNNDLEHHKKVKEWNKKSYQKNIETIRERDRKRGASRIEYTNNIRRNIKRECFEKYSDGDVKCSVCGIDDFDVLTLDHINGGGRKMARLIGLGNGVGGYRLYLYLKRNNYPDGFRILCFNCQHKEAIRLGFFDTSKMERRSNRK